MWQAILKSLKEVTEQWSKLSMGKRLGLGIVAVLVVSCMIALGAWVGEKSYAPLYTNLQPDNSIALVKILQEERIPYLVSDEGKTISIPPEFVQPTLMKLAVRGIPGGQKPGLELFDKESFGTSSYVQRINYVRAITGELTRTINTLKSVHKSSIHISMPPKSSFLENSEDPKASVMIELNPGAALSKQEVKGVQNLVASSVEGLRPERVTVVDSSGRALSSSGDAFSALSSTMMERQQQVESDMEARVEDLVSRIMGQGNVVVRVNAELDFDPMREQETIFDPEQTAVKSQAKQENNADSSRAANPPAVAGAQSALPGPASTAASQPEATQHVSKTGDKSDYEVSSKVRNHEKALGAVKRLTVSVLVNGNVVTVGKDGKSTTKAMPDDKKQSIEKLVKDAVGYVGGRDSITIESATFATEDLEKADQMLVQRDRRDLMFSLVRYGSVAFLIFLFFMVVVRPFIRWLTGLSTNKVETILPRTVEELEQMHDSQTNSLPGLANLPLLEENVDLEKAETELLKERIISLIDMAPSKAGQILSDWMITTESAPQIKSRRR